MLTDNLDLPGSLINGSTGTVVRIHIPNPVSSPLSGVIYVQFDDKEAGSSFKNQQLPEPLRSCVAVEAHIKPFWHKVGDRWVSVERKQYPFILAYALTVHKSQGATLPYVAGDLSRRTDKFNKNGTEYSCPVAPGAFYTLASRPQTSQGLSLENFDESVIQVSHSVKGEMERMRRDCKLKWVHPLLNLNEDAICLFNIVSWQLHLPHFLSHSLHSDRCSVLCFTETHCAHGHASIKQYLPHWEEVHNYTTHGLSVCFNAAKVTLVKEFSTCSNLEILPLHLQLSGNDVLLILLYRKPGPIGNFFNILKDELAALFSQLPSSCRKLVLGDFNFDQRYAPNSLTLLEFTSHFHLTQRCTFSTHVRGGILDLVLDSSNNESVDWCPSPFSDHFHLFFV